MNKHITHLMARTYECDSNGHVNHAVYVNYLEHARMQFLLDNGFDYNGFVAAGYHVIITRTDLSYKLPTFAQDQLRITTAPEETRKVRGIIAQEIWRGNDLILSAKIHWAVVNHAGRPTRPPADFSFSHLTP